MDFVKDRTLIVLFVSAFLLRIIFIAFFRDEILSIQEHTFGDTQEYILMAKNFISGNGVIISSEKLAFRPPLYPVYLGVIYFLFGDGFWAIRIAQAALDGLTCCIIYLLGSEVFSPKAGRAAGVISAVYPFFIFFSGFELTETLFVFLVAGTFLFLWRASTLRDFILSGFLLGLSCLCRPTMLGFAPLVFVRAAFSAPADRQTVFKKTLLTFLFFLITVAPWTVRNYIHFHRFVPVTTMSGRVFWEGNNPHSRGGPCQHWPEEINGLSELERDTYLREATLSYIKDEPGRFVRLMGRKFIRFWNIIPNAAQFSSSRYKLISIFSYGLVLPLGVIGIILSLKMRRRLLLFYLVIGYFTLSHMVFLASLRYRLPIMPFMIMFAGYCVASCNRLIYQVEPHK